MKRFIGWMGVCLVVTGYLARELVSATPPSFGSQLQGVQDRIQQIYPDEQVFLIGYTVDDPWGIRMFIETAQFPHHSTSIKKEWIFTPATETLVELTDHPDPTLDRPVQPIDLLHLTQAPQTILDTAFTELGIDDYHQNPDAYRVLMRVRSHAPIDPPDVQNTTHPLWIVDVRNDEGSAPLPRLWIDAHTGDVVLVHHRY